MRCTRGSTSICTEIHCRNPRSEFKIEDKKRKTKKDKLGDYSSLTPAPFRGMWATQFHVILAHTCPRGRLETRISAGFTVITEFWGGGEYQPRRWTGESPPRPRFRPNGETLDWAESSSVWSTSERPFFRFPENEQELPISRLQNGPFSFF